MNRFRNFALGILGLMACAFPALAQTPPATPTPVPASGSSLDPSVLKEVTWRIEFMVYDEIKILAHRYLDTSATAAQGIQIGQEKIAELHNQIMTLCGGKDAPNSVYQAAVAQAAKFEQSQVDQFFTDPNQKAEVTAVYSRYSQMGIQGE